MKTLSVMVVFAAALFVAGCQDPGTNKKRLVIAGRGQMPDLATDNMGNCHLVFGSADSIFYINSNDGGKSFSEPELISVLPQLMDYSMRGPQIVSTASGVTVIACNKPGNIFSYTKDGSGKWSQAVKVNDVDTVAKEAFMAMGADGNRVFAAWLDLRADKRNKIVGSSSTDGGRTWSKNSIVYASPDSSVCECCKPSVAVEGENVYVMFRNWLNGKRDLYLIQSVNGGSGFGAARQLGNDSWMLNGCPMDGGGLALNNKGEPQTVWRRKTTLYACRPGDAEIAIGEGKSCTLACVNGKNIYAWTDSGKIIVRKPEGMNLNLGSGQHPLLKRINNEHVLCVWESDKQIHAATVAL